MNEAERMALEEMAQELRGIAGFGLNFATNAHDIERFENVLGVSARLSTLLDGGVTDERLIQYLTQHFDVGPVASGEAAVFHAGKLLLIQRTDDGLWALPGGITDPGETLAETARRELWEEAGVDGRVTQLLGLFDSRLWHSEKKIHFYHGVFLIDPEDPTPRPGEEVSAAQYFTEEALPPLSPGHHLRVPFVFRQRRGEAPIPFFDPTSEDRLPV